MDESRNGPDCAYLVYLSNKEPVLIPAVINDCLDWQRLFDTPHEVMQRFNQDSWLFTQQVMQAAIDRNAGRYVVGLPNLYGPYDTLAALREPLALCLDLLDCPALVQQAAHSVLAGLTAVRDVFWRQIRTAGFGSAGWIPAYSEEAVGLLSCDFWGLLAPATVEALILPLLQQEMQPFNHCLFHLDGPSALSHLDLLLALPGLDAIQWDYGPGQGPAARWLKTYRRIQAAGKSLQVLAQDAADALTVLETLGGKGVWLTIEQPFVSRGEVDSFMKEVERKS
jgi:hypothetical protein